MKVRLAGGVFILALACLFAISTTTSQTTKSQSKKPSPDSLSESEHALLDEINQARANPQLYASYLENMKPLFSGKQYTAQGRNVALITEEGWAAVEDAIKFLRAAKPCGPLNPSRGLSLAAQTHVKEQSGTGMTGHQGSSGMIEDRVRPFGKWQGDIGENITYGNDSARERLLTWLIDDGVPTRGHRIRVLSSTYKVAGISCGAHPEFGGVCVLTLAGGFVDVPVDVKASSPTNKNANNTPNTKLKARKM
jgi:uncharacterized protein YkwD